MKTKIIIGLVIVGAAGYALFLWQISKTGAANERVRQAEQARKDLNIYFKALSDSLAASRKTNAINETDLRAALKDVAASRDRENLYKSKIRIDSILLEEIKLSDAKNDSLSRHYTADDWNCYLAKQSKVPAQGCN